MKARGGPSLSCGNFNDTPSRVQTTRFFVALLSAKALGRPEPLLVTCRFAQK
jgi:hypothetical protein